MSRVEPNRNVYVGHRYVPKIMGEWDKSTDYEGLSIVLYKGGSYTSKKRVPVGIDILNEEYWAITGNYNAQVDYYRDETERVANDLLLKSDKTYVDNELGKKSDKTYVDTELGKKSNKTYVDTELGKKADQSYTDTELGKKADKSYTDTELGKKADNTYVDDLSDNIGYSDDIEKSDISIWEELQTRKVTPNWFNVKGDGVTDDTVNLNLMFEYAYENKLVVDLLDKTYLITDTVHIKYNVDGSRASFICDPIKNKPAVIVGIPGTPTFRMTAYIPNITNKSMNWTDGSIGAKTYNLNESDITFGLIDLFQTGLQLSSLSGGHAYNTIRARHLKNNRVNMLLQPDNQAGWVNENNIYVERFSQQINVTGRSLDAHVHINNGNNNVFYKPSFENGVEKCVIFENAKHNNIFHGRYELSDKRIFDFIGYEGSGLTHSNIIMYGYNVETMETIENEHSIYNHIFSRNGIRSQGTGEGVFTGSNRLSAGSPVFGVYPPRTKMEDMTADNQTISISSNGINGKVPDNVFNSFEIRSTGAILLGSGLEEMKKTLRSYGDRLRFDNTNVEISDGSWDSGHLMLGRHHLWIDTTGVLRIKNGVPSSDTDGTAVGDQTSV